MAWENLGFETAGTNPGEADAWTVGVSAAVDEAALYAVSVTAIYYAWEPFDYLWSGNEGSRYTFIPADLSVAEYVIGAPPDVEYEGFEEAWNGNEDDVPEFVAADLDGASYYPAMPYDETETFGNPITFVPVDPENYIGTDWAGDPWKNAFHTTDLTNAVYDAEAYEDFEEGWRSNENDELVAFDPADIDPASFHAGFSTMQDYENFESVFVERTFAVNPVTDVLTLSEPHTLPLNAPMHVRIVGGILPDPLNASFTYYVETTTPPNDIKISTSAGGAAVDIVDEGVGEPLIVADPLWYWNDSLD